MLFGYHFYVYVYCELTLYVITYQNLWGWRFEWLRPEKSTKGQNRHICIAAWTRGNKLRGQGGDKCCHIFLPLCVITAVLKAVKWTCVCCVHNFSCVVSCHMFLCELFIYFFNFFFRLALQRSGSRHNRKSEM